MFKFKIQNPDSWTRLLQDQRVSCEILLRGESRIRRIYKQGHRRLPDHVIWFIINGKAFYTADDHEQECSPGDLVWIPADTPHMSHFTPGCHSYFLRVRLSKGKTLFRPENLHYRSPHSWHCLPHFKQLLLESKSPQDHHESLVRAYLSILFIELLRKNDAPNDLSGLGRRQVESLNRYLMEHSDQHVSVSDLAKHLGYTTDYFSRQFKKSFQQSPRSWILQIRIEAAKQLLSEGRLSIAEVAHSQGYTDVNLFSRQFFQLTGMRPMRFRSELV